MRPVSDAFLTTLRGSHRMVADARVLTSYQEGVDPSGIDIVPVVAATVPEPGTLALLALGALGIVQARRRKAR